MIQTSKKRARKLLRNAGKEFTDGFLSAYNWAIPLRSKEPGLCWNDSGQVAFAVINEFSGPNAMDEDAPLLLRLRTNLYPPPAIYYHLNSPKIRRKLGVSQEPFIATEPPLELTALPEEIGKFGKWLTEWLYGQSYPRAICPKPPVDLVSWNCGDELKDEREDLTKLGQDWKLHLYLWTPGAMAVFEPWLKN